MELRWIILVGCSSGSIIASLYAAGYTPTEILNIVVYNYKKLIDYDGKIGFKLINTVFTKKLNIKGFVKGNRLEKTLRYFLQQRGVQNISDIKMPIAIPVVKLKNGEIIYFSNKVTQKQDFCSNFKNSKKNINVTGLVGNFAGKQYDDFPTCINYGELADIVRASCSFPGVFVPKVIDGIEYIDGGVRVNTPVEVLRHMGADKIIAVSFDCNNKSNDKISNIVGISEQAFNIISHTSNNIEQYNADVNIRLCIKNVSLLDFSKTQLLAKRGYNIVARNINQIKRLLEIE